MSHVYKIYRDSRFLSSARRAGRAEVRDSSAAGADDAGALLYGTADEAANRVSGQSSRALPLESEFAPLSKCRVIAFVLTLGHRRSDAVYRGKRVEATHRRSFSGYCSSHVCTWCL